MGPEVLNTPAVGVVAALEHLGVTFELREDGRLALESADRIPADLAEAIRQHRDQVALLAAWLNVSVRARYDVFAAQALARTDIVLPVLTFKPLIVWERGRCWSCGDPHRAQGFGRCFPCRAAACLVMNVPIPIVLQRETRPTLQGVA